MVAVCNPTNAPLDIWVPVLVGFVCCFGITHKLVVSLCWYLGLGVYFICCWCYFMHHYFRINHYIVIWIVQEYNSKYLFNGNNTEQYYIYSLNLKFLQRYIIWQMVGSHRFYIIMYYFTIIDLIVLTDFMIFIYDTNILDHFIISTICKAKFEGSIKRKLKFTNKIKRLTYFKIANHSRNFKPQQKLKQITKFMCIL